MFREVYYSRHRSDQETLLIMKTLLRKERLRVRFCEKEGTDGLDKSEI
jgi:hypothetical protein